MLIGIPVGTDEGLEIPVFPHFGRASYFALVDSETGECTSIVNGSSHNGGTKLPPEWLHDVGVQVLLCTGLGQRAISLFEEHSIPVYIGAADTVRGMVEAFNEGHLQLATLADGCAH